MNPIDTELAASVPGLALTLFSPSGVLADAARLRRARKRLQGWGFAVQVDEAASRKAQRFAGNDEERLAALHRIADAAPDVALATRGGYGLTRLLPAIDWARIRASIERGTRWVGYSDLTALQMGLLAHGGGDTWCGPLACDDFCHADRLDETTAGCFVEAMTGLLEGVGFRTEAGLSGASARGTLWGGNLSVLCSLLGTPHLPRIKGGVLLLEDVAEHPYRVERMLLQLAQAGILGAQKAVLLGAFSDWKPSPLDKGYTLKTALAQVRAACPGVPFITGLPFGHVPTKICLPFGRRVQVEVDGRNAWVAWGHPH
ncbi:MAG: LD-carboxypeptidase [Proteobacteria bacterium]|nr:LD-carboxypeptidase [Pseudomonadota bacterium]